MKIQSYNQFKLLKSSLPEIIKNKVINDTGVGGIKLVYKVTIHQCITFLLFDKCIILPLPWPLKVPSIQKIFLKPYKEYYSNSERDDLPKSLWGKTNDPLTALWIEMEFDYETIKKGFIVAKKEIRNTDITKHLNKIERVFFVKSKNNQFV